MSDQMSGYSDSMMSDLITQTRAGQAEALEALVLSIQPKIYNLALRMLQMPADAEDATQEILIKVITHLSEFRGESQFTSWVYRIATNHLLTTRAQQAGTYMTFEALDEQIALSLAVSAQAGADVEDIDQRELEEEVKRSCTLGMLLCLDREYRITFILAEVVQVNSIDGAYILDITPQAFRKRASRARAAIGDFVSHTCGIVNPANPCRCKKHVANKINAGLLDPRNLQYADQTDAASQTQTTLAQKQDLSEIERVNALFCSHPSYKPSSIFLDELKQWVAGWRLQADN